MILSSALLITTSAIAEEYAFKKQLKARQSFMQVYAYNLGLLGAMAKGGAEYDAEIANSAAKMENSPMLSAGSGADDDGLADKTRAKAEIWSSFPEVGEKHKNLTTALTNMAEQAGIRLDAVKANMGTVGDGCKGCHENIRVPKV